MVFEENVVPSNLKMTLVPRVSTTLVTIGLLNSSPTNSGWPAVLTGAKILPRLVSPWKNSMLVVFGSSTLMKTAPNPREAAETTVEFAALGATNLKSIPLSLNIANVFGWLKAGKRPLTFGLTSAKPSLLTA